MMRNEQISALIDNELTDEAMLNSLKSDGNARGQWQRYQLYGDVMRGEVAKTLDIDLSDRIALALEAEAPHQSGVKDNNVVALPQRSKHRSKWLHSVGQYAIAASVAVMAIIGVQTYQSQSASQSDSQQPLPVFNTVPVGGTVSPVSLQTHLTREKSMTEEQWLNQRKEIAAYLQDHQQQQREQP
ncbi:sigma-E factor negative regulatory protein [Celerinatantimonas sp. YJH-8]|uniref:sigma-E factor negative regulatory protein n=1 Tax=Celerinatantimonas sp. YJH-8 TaxID=3228714 RepID=UPI0038C186F0